jgi:hypothetical protein
MAEGKEKDPDPTMSRYLFITFLVLKLVHQIDWSWWWITAPLWGFLLIVVLGAAGKSRR